MVKTGSSYCSQSELPLTFGLGPDGRVAKLDIAWPSGRQESIAWPPLGRTLTIAEGSGLIDSPHPAPNRRAAATAHPDRPRP
jgi:hypothetical protein